MLQWMLLLIGAIIIAAVYVYTRYQTQRKTPKLPKSSPYTDTPHIDDQRLDEGNAPDDTQSGKTLPEIGLEEPELEPNPELETEPELKPEPEPKPKEDELPAETIFTLNICAQGNQQWSGDEIMKCAGASKLQSGDKNIFEYHHPQSDEETSEAIFYVANYVNPGIFDWDKMSEFKTKGLTVVMRLPLASSAKDALDRMLSCAQHLTEVLGGELCDNQRQPLNKQQVKDMYATCKQYDALA